MLKAVEQTRDEVCAVGWDSSLSTYKSIHLKKVMGKRKQQPSPKQNKTPDQAERNERFSK